MYRTQGRIQVYTTYTKYWGPGLWGAREGSGPLEAVGEKKEKKKGEKKGEKKKKEERKGKKRRKGKKKKE